MSVVEVRQRTSAVLREVLNKKDLHAGPFCIANILSKHCFKPSADPRSIEHIHSLSRICLPRTMSAFCFQRGTCHMNGRYVNHRTELGCQQEQYPGRHARGTLYRPGLVLHQRLSERVWLLSLANHPTIGALSQRSGLPGQSLDDIRKPPRAPVCLPYRSFSRGGPFAETPNL
jgi:hypothetical protein